MPHDAKATNLLTLAFGIINKPVPRNKLNGLLALVTNSDGVSKTKDLVVL